MTRLLVGLGNPGSEYEWTPHNLGFHVVERLASDARVIFETTTTLDGFSLPAPCALARLPVWDALVCKPLTWMNRSGVVVAPLYARLSLEPRDLIVVHDELDLALDELWIRPQGGSGGHRGVASIVELLGSDQFPRLRVGVGRPRTDAARHVLKRMSGDELERARIIGRTGGRGARVLARARLARQHADAVP